MAGPGTNCVSFLACFAAYMGTGHDVVSGRVWTARRASNTRLLHCKERARKSLRDKSCHGGRVNGTGVD